MRARRPAAASTLLIVLAGCGTPGATTEPSDRPTGSLEVRVSTSGDDRDPDGYTVSVGTRSQAVAAQDSVVFESLPSGSYTVSLRGVASNCAVSEGNPRACGVTASGQAYCWGAGAGSAIPVAVSFP